MCRVTSSHDVDMSPGAQAQNCLIGRTCPVYDTIMPVSGSRERYPSRRKNSNLAAVRVITKTCQGILKFVGGQFSWIVGYLLICCFVISWVCWFSVSERKKTHFKFVFIEDVNWQRRATHEYHEKQGTVNSNDSSVGLHIMTVWCLMTGCFKFCFKQAG